MELCGEVGSNTGHGNLLDILRRGLEFLLRRKLYNGHRAQLPPPLPPAWKTSVNILIIAPAQKCFVYHSCQDLGHSFREIQGFTRVFEKSVIPDPCISALHFRENWLIPLRNWNEWKLYRADYIDRFLAFCGKSYSICFWRSKYASISHKSL